MLSRLFLLAGFLLAALAPATAKTERRVALVVGNSEYAHASALRNPRNDASDMADALRGLGFEVLVGLDLDQQKFATNIDRFARMLDGADVGLFYYAGHGLQINDKNLLVSTTARLTSEFLVPSETIELDTVVKLMESKTPTNLVFLDACRNNPLAEDLRRNLAALKRTVSLGRGLARVEPTGRDTLIAFAAAPGQEAIDGMSRNSPFTSALLKYLPQPGLEVSVMLKQVAADVRRETNNAQRPQQLSDMSNTFFFAPPETAVASVKNLSAAVPELPTVAQTAAAIDSRNLEVAFWNAAQSASECEAMRAYSDRFPNGVFIELARLAERRLCTAAAKTAAVQFDGGTRPVAAGPSDAPAAAVTAVSAPASSAAANVQLASVDPDPKPLGRTSTAENSSGDVARLAQLELIRLGCGEVEADGRWGSASRSAIRLFNKHGKAKLAADEPTNITLAALRRHEGRVCPLQCDRGYRARGNTCVAVAKREPTRSARKAEPPRQRRYVASRPAARAEQAPAPQPQHQPTSGMSFGVAPVGLMLGGRFRFR
jgi:uncharacterized caspase-like protein